MYEVSPGKYRLQFAADEEREIVVSLGLKGELYRLITRKQIELQKLTFKNLLSDTDKQQIKSLTAELTAISQSEEKDETKIAELTSQLDLAYVEAYSLLDQRQKEFMEEIAVGTLTVSEDCVAECIALLLTKRDKRGEVLPETKVTAEQILWADEYVSVQTELIELLNAVVIYMQSTLKKISPLSQMLQSLGQGEQKS
jgi:CRISPR/Cas system CMR subunit Cmr4 (Cas7 group RAMP superfamily)